MLRLRLWGVLLVCILGTSACNRAEHVKECIADEDCDDGNGCTSDLCTVGECHYLPFPDGLNCNDEDPCTTKDVCVSGECQGQQKDCSAYGGICTEGACDPQSGECGPEPKPNGTECDDGLYCTVDDSCLSGTCTGNQRTCDDGDECTLNECNEGEKKCNYILETKPGAEGPPGDPTCNNSTDDDCDRLVDDQDPNCVACTQDSGCDDGNPCTDDTCQDNICHNDPVSDGTGCDDGRYCTEPDTCTAGVCGGAARDCSAFSDSCNDGVCVESNNACEAQPKVNDTPCEDGLYCNIGETCQSGACTGGEARDCDDSDFCTVDTCNEDTDVCDNTWQSIPGAEGPPGDPTCSNNVDDDCDGLTDLEDGNCFDCVSDADCNDNNQCTDDDCASGLCTNVQVNDGTSCNDANPCTHTDECSGGACAGTPYTCDDSEPCTDNVCNGDSTCSYPDNTDPCDDQDPCTHTDTCSGGSCAGTPYTCDDSEPCTDNVCNGDSTCFYPDNTDPCDDGDPCSTLDTCSGGSCQAGATNKDTDADTYFDDQCPGGDDCNDDDYDTNPGVFEGPEGDPKCSDGKDNDCDGLTDLADLDCLDLCDIMLTTIERDSDGAPIPESHNHRIFSPQAPSPGEAMFPNISGINQKFFVYGQFGIWDTVSCTNSSWLPIDYGEVTFEVFPQFAGDEIFSISGVTGVGTSVASATNHDRVDVIRATVDTIPNVCTGGVCQSEISVNACGEAIGAMEQRVADTFTSTGFTENAQTTFAGDDSIRYYAVEGFKPPPGTACTFTETADSQPWYLDMSEDAVWVSQTPGIATVSNTPGSKGNLQAISPGSTLIQANWGGGAPEDQLAFHVTD